MHALIRPPRRSRLNDNPNDLMPTAHSNTATAMRCPQCQQGGLRRSKRRRGDSIWHRLFFSAYRCRDCRARSWRFDGGRLAVVAVTGAVVASLGAVMAFVVGGDLGLNEADASSPEPALALAPAARPRDAMRNDAPREMHLAAHPDLPQRAEQGDAKAQSGLALAYLNGQGVPKDVGLARQWAEKAALQGHAEGQYILGSMYLAGTGVLQDFPTALKWFEKAAQQNHAAAQYRLGLAYYNGYGVGVDKTKAYFWFNLAAAQAQPEATAARDRLLPLLTAEQIASAQREGLAWKPAAAKP